MVHLGARENDSEVSGMRGRFPFSLFRISLALFILTGGAVLFFIVWAGVQIAQHSREPIERFFEGSSTKQKRPIVIVHGLNRSGRMWVVPDDGHGNLLPGALSMVEFLRANGYPNIYLNTLPDTRNTSLLENARTLKGWIEQVKKRYRTERVDLLTHSLGALVARAYLQELDRKDGNPTGPVSYGQDVARLIMISAPHLGSPLADSVPPFLNWYARRTLREGGGTDLQRLNARPLPCGAEYHSILVSADNRERSRGWSFWRVMRVLLASARPEDGDGTLSLRSQNLTEAIGSGNHPCLMHLAHPVQVEGGIGHRDAPMSRTVQQTIIRILDAKDQ